MKNKNNITKKTKQSIIKNDDIYPKIHDCNIANYKEFGPDIKDDPIYNNSTNYESDILDLIEGSRKTTTTRANDDFYGYINYFWLKTADKETQKYKKETKYFSQVDNYRIIQHKVYGELSNKIKKYIDDNKNPMQQHVKAIYNSYMKCSPKILAKHSKLWSDTIDSFYVKDDLIGLIVEINKSELMSWSAPIFWRIDADLKETSIYENYITGSSLSLSNYDLYFEFDDDTKEIISYKQTVKKKYLEYIDNVFIACYGKNNGYISQYIIDVEIEILHAYGGSDIKNVNPDNYNIVTVEESMKIYGFDWDMFSKKLGFEETPKTFIVENLNYLVEIVKILKERWKTEKWRQYFVYIIVTQYIKLTPITKHIDFDFFENFLNGQEEISPDEIDVIVPLSFTFNTLLSNLYVKIHNNPQTIDFTGKFCRDLLVVFNRIITNENTFYSPKAKKMLLLKIDKMQIVVGQPSILREDPLLNYTNDDIIYNMMLLSKWKTDKYLKLLRKPLIDIPLFNWQQFKMTGRQCYLVNASYEAVTNSIYIPIAYLQSPFVDLEERGIEFNLASLGYAISHEICHSIDRTGSRFDELGNLNDWWSKNDLKNYNRIQSDIMAQYDEYARRDGIIYDTSLIIDESMADIGAIWICQEFLRDYQMYKKYEPAIIYLSFQTFYIYFAILQKQFIYKRAIQGVLSQNAHPLSKYRTNIPLSRLLLFRKMYKIKKGDKMWWPNFCSVFENSCSKGKYKTYKNKAFFN